MKISTTYHRSDPDTVMGHKVVLTQVYYSQNEIEIDLIENAFKTHFGSGTVAEINMNDFMSAYIELISNPSGGVD